MTATFTDIIDAMIKAEEDGLSPEKVILTDESFDSFLTDDKFKKSDEQRQKDTIGTDWGIYVEKGDENYLIADGEEFPL